VAAVAHPARQRKLRREIVPMRARLAYLTALYLCRYDLRHWQMAASYWLLAAGKQMHAVIADCDRRAAGPLAASRKPQAS